MTTSKQKPQAGGKTAQQNKAPAAPASATPKAGVAAPVAPAKAALSAAATKPVEKPPVAKKPAATTKAAPATDVAPSFASRRVWPD